MFKIFGQKNRRLAERKLALVSQIKQLKNESVKSNTKTKLLELASKKGLVTYYDYTKQGD